MLVIVRISEEGGIGEHQGGEALIPVAEVVGEAHFGHDDRKGGTGNNRDKVHFVNSTLADNKLPLISFCSDTGSSLVGNAFQITSGTCNREIIAVPETETYFYAVALLAGIVIQYLRRRAKRKPLQGHRPA
jgi:hypothetical protein